VTKEGSCYVFSLVFEKFFLLFVSTYPKRKTAAGKVTRVDDLIATLNVFTTSSGHYVTGTKITLY